MTSESTIRNRPYSRHLNVAGLLILLAVCGLRSASAQHTQSQRRLSAGEGPQGPIEQLRLLMHLQHLQSQFQPPDAPTKRNGENPLPERPRNRKGIPKKNGVAPDNAFPAPQETTIQDATKVQNDLQRPQEQLSRLLPGATPPARDSSNQQEILRGDETGNLKRNQSQNRSKNGSLNRSRSGPPGVSSQPAAHSDESFQPDSNLLQEIAKNYPALLNSPEFKNKIMELQERQFNKPSNTAEESSSAFDISKELSKSGLTKTFTQLFREIQSKVQTEQGTESKHSDSPANENSTLNQALFRVLDAGREVVVETVRKSREDRKDRGSRSGQKSAGTENSPGQPTDRNKNSASLNTSVPKQEPPPPEASTGNSPFTPPGDLPDWGSSLNDNASTQLFIILFGLGAAAAMCFLVARQRLRARSQSYDQRLTAFKPENIRTREDIIRAFHWLTHCQSPDAADWWNHLQATESLSQHSVGRDESLRQLVALYEAARYQPAKRTFDQAHIQQARIALAGCLS
jgi:hypothetical protein